MHISIFIHTHAVLCASHLPITALAHEPPVHIYVHVVRNKGELCFQYVYVMSLCDPCVQFVGIQLTMVC